MLLAAAGVDDDEGEAVQEAGNWNDARSSPPLSKDTHTHTVCFLEPK